MSSEKVGIVKRVRPMTEDDLKTEHLAQLIKLISDEKSIRIFKTIFLASGDSSDVLRKHLKLTRKQYYSRVSRLIKAGLVRRQKGRYFPTAFGRVFYDSQK